MSYVCVSCEEKIDMDPVDEKVICPNCSHRVLFKKAPETPTRVEAV